MPARRGQFRLRTGGDDTPQRVHNRTLQPVCQLGGLVETALPSASRVERHRYYAVGVEEDCGPGLTHDRAESDGERVPSFVFQEVDKLPQGALVGPDRA